ncbi:MAG: 2-oxo-4-hydroxy-4-carboxy-5-ureidoimidazoline decarboxylase [Actinomycetota bacterium]|nr:2-oxo-4-hydroxy-4-carboxy-5-ureidoimidazoline decarboxylase [Actinomycetota bacterium]
MAKWTLDMLNTAPDDERLRAALAACCAADSWAARIVAGRPYRAVAALCAVSDDATHGLSDTGLGQALAGHPRIGERASGHGGTWSRQEQAGMSDSDGDVRTQLASANADYEQHFGHVYLVCATGKSADELLATCRSRLANDPATEHNVVLGELAKINRLRLGKLLHAET